MIKKFNNLYLSIIIKPHAFFLLIILFLSFAIRLVNLNYNSAFNDEAVNIVIGRLGIFQGDWRTYNTSTWFAGFPYIYPPITSIASVSGGIVGSRLFNVIVGVLTVEIVFIFTVLLSRLKQPYDYIAGLIAAVLVGGSSIGLYVSRIATYDILSFYLLFLGLVSLLEAELPYRNKGRLYFYSAFILLLACLTKIIIFVYLPLIVIYSYIRARQKGKEYLHFWKIYFFAPILIITSIYLIGNLTALTTYAKVNTTREKIDFSVFADILWHNSAYNWFFWFVGSLGLFMQKRLKLWLILTLLAIWMMIPHLLSQRADWTFEKQILLTVCFITPIAAIGIAYFLTFLQNTYLKATAYISLAIILSLYWIISYKNAQLFNYRWENSNNALKYLSDHVKLGDKVLAESGATAILALYDKNFPTNTTTFDWFTYHKMQGESAYIAAVQDGYFDMVELGGLEQPGAIRTKTLRNDLYKNLADNYKLVYENNGFLVYKRTF